MTQTHTPIRLLITHREADEAVLVLARGLAQLPDFEVYITREGISSPTEEEGVTLLPCPPITGKVNLSVIRLLRRYTKQYHFDLTYSPGSSGLSNALMATLGLGTKNVAYRGTGARVRRTDPTYYLGILNPRVRHVVCETEHVEGYLRGFFPEDMLTVATKPFSLPWADKALAAPIAVEALRDKELRLSMVANNKGRPFKGLRTLLEAMVELNDHRVGLVLVGNYDDEDRAWIESTPVGADVVFVGEMPEAMPYMAGTDVYVLPSWRDASPRVVREAMSLSLPTIVSDIPGSRDLILPGQTGLLAPAQDAKALSEAIRWMLTHPEERRAMGDRGVSASLVTSVLLLTRGFSPVFSARSPHRRISVRRAPNFRAHENFPPSAQRSDALLAG